MGCEWTGEFDLNTLRVNGKKIESGKKNLVGSHISGYVWTEPLISFLKGLEKPRYVTYTEKCLQKLFSCEGFFFMLKR